MSNVQRNVATARAGFEGLLRLDTRGGIYAVLLDTTVEPAGSAADVYGDDCLAPMCASMDEEDALRRALEGNI